MMSYLRSYDSFGEPVSLNYKGDSSYKTLLGAVMTLCLNTFLLVYAADKLLALVKYQDPSVTQYTIYEPRNESDAFNLGEAKGSIVFGMHNIEYGNMVTPSPSILTIDFQITTLPTLRDRGTVVKDVETENATLEKHPEYLTGYLRNFVKEDGSTDLLVVKDPYSVDLDMNYLSSLDAHKLSIFV